MPIETIFAPATATARAGVSVFRISGPSARLVLSQCLKFSDLPVARQAVLCRLYHPQNGDVIDRVLALWFPSPHSFTGEDVVELHTHGGRAILHAVTGALLALPGFRVAEAGEFSRRAFHNDKMDLTEAEAIADLVNAETEAQRKQALRQMEGELQRLYEDWRKRLLHILAYLEASIDFADDDLPAGAIEKRVAGLGALKADIAHYLNDHHRGERLRDGFYIAIVGAPNAGKSSLLNALARRDVAIVSSTPGTTRDVIEVALDLGGYPVTLADTAGLRESVDVIEGEGIRRALDRAEKADLKIVVFDGAVWPAMDSLSQSMLDESAIMVVNKADIGALADMPVNALLLSSKTGQGVDALLAKLRAVVEQFMGQTSTLPLTRARHRHALQECVECLDRALLVTEADLRAEDVRLASRALGRITGRVDVEDLLDVIFRDFCIGK